MKKLVVILSVFSLVNWSNGGSWVSNPTYKPYPRITAPQIYPAQYSGMETNVLTNTVDVISYAGSATFTNVFDGVTNVYTVATGAPVTNAVEVISTNTVPIVNTNVYADCVIKILSGTELVGVYSETGEDPYSIIYQDWVAPTYQGDMMTYRIMYDVPRWDDDYELYKVELSKASSVTSHSYGDLATVITNSGTGYFDHAWGVPERVKYKLKAGYIKDSTTRSEQYYFILDFALIDMGSYAVVEYDGTDPEVISLPDGGCTVAYRADGYWGGTKPENPESVEFWPHDRHKLLKDSNLELRAMAGFKDSGGNYYEDSGGRSFFPASIDWFTKVLEVE